jgi:SPP1 family predicted phage head-tail adaptor
MRAGQLRHRITFQQLTVANDTWGHSVETWTDQFDTWASIWPLRGTERMEGLKLDNEITHKVRIRYRSGIHPKMRIKFGTRYFNMSTPINPDERNIYLEFMATEEV